MTQTIVTWKKDLNLGITSIRFSETHFVGQFPDECVKAQVTSGSVSSEVLRRTGKQAEQAWEAMQ